MEPNKTPWKNNLSDQMFPERKPVSPPPAPAPGQVPQEPASPKPFITSQPAPTVLGNSVVSTLGEDAMTVPPQSPVSAKPVTLAPMPRSEPTEPSISPVPKFPPPFPPIPKNPSPFASTAIPASSAANENTVPQVPPLMPSIPAKVPSMTPPPSTPVQPSMTPPPASRVYQPPQKSKKVLMIVIIVAIVLVAAGALAYFDGGKIFGSAPYNTDQLASSIFSGITKIDTASYALNLNIASEPKEAGVESFDVAVPASDQKASSRFTDMTSSLAYIPGNFKFDGTLSGASEKTSDSKINGQVRAAATVDFGDATFAVDAEFKKISDDFFFSVHKLPALITDITKIKDKWIKMTAEEIAARGGSYFGSSSDASKDDIEQAKQRTIEQFKLFLTVADKNKALQSIGSPSREDVAGVSAYKYTLEFNKATLGAFYKELTTEFQAKYADKNTIKFDQSVLDYINSPEFDKVFEYFRKNTELTLWADSAGIPVQARYSLRMVPDSTAKNADRQIKFVTTITLSNVNKSVSIEVPKETMSMEDATLAMTGQSKEAYQMAQQIRAVSDTVYALDAYENIKSSYPKTLNELTTTKMSYGDYMILNKVPTDTYTKTPFVYSSTGKDYSLTYNITLPKYVAGTSIRNIFDENYSSTSKIRMIMKVVNGVNTATSKYRSSEAYAISQKDTDGDGVPDAIEKYIGSNLNKKDTDGDGKSDYDEIEANTNPLGPGGLKGSY